MEQELLTLPRHVSSTFVLVVFVLLNLQFSVQCFVDNCLCCSPFSFDYWGSCCSIQFSVWCCVDNCLCCGPFSFVYWSSCCSISSFLQSVLQIIVCAVFLFHLLGFMLLNHQFSVWHCPFSFSHCIICHSIYMVLLIFCFLQTFSNSIGSDATMNAKVCVSQIHLI